MTLYIRIGPMFSGKTTWLNNELTQLSDKGFSVLKIIHMDDDRGDVAKNCKSGSTHNSSYTSLSDKITCVKCQYLKNINVDKYQFIGIDESQFFPDLSETVEYWVETKKKNIKLVGLDGDANKKKFGQTLDLIPICDEVVKMNASCHNCLKQLEKINFKGNMSTITGPFTKYINQPSPLTQQKNIGGSDIYIPVCRYHHSH